MGKIVICKIAGKIPISWQKAKFIDIKERVRVFNRKIQELLNIDNKDIVGKEFEKCKFKSRTKN